MSDKRVKAWAVVSVDGNIVIDSITEAHDLAKLWMDDGAGKRVVRVTIIAEDE